SQLRLSHAHRTRPDQPRPARTDRQLGPQGLGNTAEKVENGSKSRWPCSLGQLSKEVRPPASCAEKRLVGRTSRAFPPSLRDCHPEGGTTEGSIQLLVATVGVADPRRLRMTCTTQGRLASRTWRRSWLHGPGEKGAVGV